MKVYGTGIYENDRADLAGLAYLHFSISQIEDVIEWMKGTDEPAQQLLGYLDMLLMIAKKFPDDANLKIKKQRVSEWQIIFNEWFVRTEKKLQKKYRDSIKNDSEKLFEEIKKYGHSISWL